MKKMLCVLGVLVMVGWLAPVMSNAGELLTDGDLDLVYAGQEDGIDVDVSDIVVGNKGGNAANKGGTIAGENIAEKGGTIASKGGEIEDLDAEKGGQIATKGGEISEVDRDLNLEDESQKDLQAEQNQNVSTEGDVGQALAQDEFAKDATSQVIQVLAGVDGMLGINVACANAAATASDTISINQAVTQISGSQCVVVGVGQVALNPAPNAQ